ncbi:MAG: sodium:proton antiporter [Wolbachia endosymbiont of Andrena labialis]|nr:sodium:proton antiporter [Wolbachia endosymbiont of Andrena labialis]
MFYLTNFLPILLFLFLFVGSGIYFTILGVSNAFYQLSPLVAIVPAIALGWVLYKGNTEEKMYAFLDGVRDRNIITMCIIFLLAGAFSEVTKAIGSADATVNLALSFIPTQFLLIGLFFVAAFISTAIGTSMGTIATIAPIAVELTQAGISPSLGVATVVGGAMFGDNLSIISDTTIASVMSQKADIKKKLKLNAKVALIASIVTIIILFYSSSSSAAISVKEYSLLLVTPYIILILLANFGINVFTALVLSITFAGIIGFINNNNYGLLFLSQNITKGFMSMHEIMLLSLMVGGLSGLVGKNSKEFADKLSSWVMIQRGGQKTAQLFIAKIVSIFDILLANNTIAIIFSGEIARDIAKKYEIPPHYSAAWLGIFSCVFQGLIPYGAQLLLASTIAGVSPLAVVPHVYYCYVLGIIAVLYIVLNKIEKKDCA